MTDPTRAACDGWNSSDCVGTVHCPPRCPRFVDKYGAQWTLRPAREADIDGLVEMYSSFGLRDRAQGLPPAGEHRLRSWLETLFDEGHNVVAAGDGRIVGHVTYTPRDEPCPELAVFVQPAVHDRGIGTELCKHAIADAAEEGREALELHVERQNRAAITVYRGLGFEVVDRTGAVQMELSLNETILETVRDTPPAGRIASD